MLQSIFGYNPLYDVKELQHGLLTPLRLGLIGGRQFYGHNFNVLANTELGRSIAASLEVLERITRDYAKPEWEIKDTVVNGKREKVSLKYLVKKDFGNLLHFSKESGEQQPKLLIVAPMSGHYPTLLRGTVKGLLPFADVYITEWVNARDIPVTKGSFDLEDYIDYVLTFLRHLKDAHVMAVCQPAVPVLAAVSLMCTAQDKHRPRSMTLIGGPIDARKSPTPVNQFAMEKSVMWLERNFITRVPYKFDGFLRPVYPGFIQLSGFMAMNLNRHIGEHMKLFQHLVEGDGESATAHKKFYNEYLAVMDLPAEFYLQTVETVFQRYLLPRRKMMWRGELVDPHAITDVPLFAIEGEKDDISGVGQTKASISLCENLPENKKRYMLAKGVGHYGLFNGRRFNDYLVPEIIGFMKQWEQ
jgi:poly(3-hydroxybutyrate) depolymerase